jgi:hypothetical protein
VHEPIGRMTPALAWERAFERCRELLDESANPVDDAEFRDRVNTLRAALLQTDAMEIQTTFDTLAYRVIGAVGAMPALGNMTDAAWNAYQELVRHQAQEERDIEALIATAERLVAMNLGLDRRQWLDRALHHVRWHIALDAHV